MNVKILILLISVVLGCFLVLTAFATLFCWFAAITVPFVSIVIGSGAATLIGMIFIPLILMSE